MENIPLYFISTRAFRSAVCFSMEYFKLLAGSMLKNIRFCFAHLLNCGIFIHFLFFIFIPRLLELRGVAAWSV